MHDWIAAQPLEALAGTFWIHTGALLGGAWCLHALFRRASPRALEHLWSGALVAGALTACAAFYVIGMPVRVHTHGAAPALEALPGLPEVVAVDRGAVQYAPVTPVPAARASHAPPRAALDEQRTLWLLACGVWLAVLLCLGIREWRGRARLARRLRGRRPVEDAAWTGALQALCERADWSGEPVRLTASTALSSPIAFGRRHPEICIPVRALDALDADMRDALLAHELAHLERRDSSRQTRARWAAAVSLQPLGAVATRRLRDLAELQCDARACELTGRPGALARCLATVAGWTQGGPSLRAPAMARPGAALEHRVRTLITDRRPRQRAGVYVAAALVGLTVAWLAPRVTLTVPLHADAVTVPLHEATDSGLPGLDAELRAAETEVAALIALVEARGANVRAQAVLQRMNTRLNRLKAHRDALARLEGEDQ